MKNNKYSTSLFIFGLDYQIASHRIRAYRLLHISDPSIKVYRVSLPGGSISALYSLAASSFSAQRIILFFPKPRSPVHALFLVLLKLFFKKAFLVVDITDDFPCYDRYLTWLHYLIDRLRYASFLKSLQLADLVTVPTTGLADLIATKYNLSSHVIPDFLDIESAPIYCNIQPEKSLKPNRILWFGNSGFKRRLGSKDSFIPSDSLKVFAEHISSDDYSSMPITICSNNLGCVRSYLLRSGISVSRLRLIEWSPGALANCLASSDIAFITYPNYNDSIASPKSLNRIELSLYSGIPALIINPPRQLVDASLSIERPSPYNLKSVNHSDHRKPILFYPNQEIIDFLLESQLSIMASWEKLFSSFSALNHSPEA